MIFAEMNPKFSVVQENFFQNQFQKIGAFDIGKKYPICVCIRSSLTQESHLFLSCDKCHQLANYEKNKRECEKARKLFMKTNKNLIEACKTKYRHIPSHKNVHYILLTIHRLKMYRACATDFIQSDEIPRMKLRQYQNR